MTRRSGKLGGGAGKRAAASARAVIERVQTGVRIERRILLVLKGLAAAHDITLGDLVEGIALHAFDGKTPFGPQSLATIKALRAVYKLDLTASDSHRLVERKR
ncbi:MAG TPA: hypothetical protein VL326_24455 [Kofleriaceae bacterium]|nr:hypothetical protein [Kofleriaceae bacterium]